MNNIEKAHFSYCIPASTYNDYQNWQQMCVSRILIKYVGILQTYIVPEMTTFGRYNPVRHRAEGCRSVHWRTRIDIRLAC